MQAAAGALLLLALWAPAWSGGVERTGFPPAGPSGIMVIPRDPSRPAKRFRVVLVCDTPASRAKGLQGFRRLQADEAAVFLFETPTDASFWMGAVPYPIDIVFVDASGTVVRVYADCRPGSRELFRSGKKILWVVETAAGADIRAGDRVEGLVRNARGSG